MSQESVAVVQPQDYPEDKEEADTDSCVATRMDHSSSVDAGGTPISSGSRKRKHPGGLESDEEPPPNKLLPTPSVSIYIQRLLQHTCTVHCGVLYMQSSVGYCLGGLDTRRYVRDIVRKILKVQCMRRCCLWLRPNGNG